MNYIFIYESFNYSCGLLIVGYKCLGIPGEVISYDQYICMFVLLTTYVAGFCLFGQHYADL